MTSSASHPDTRILVIDDHAISRHFTITALKQLAVTVRQARTGNEAITIARSCLPGLIFTDINLPDSCGLAVIAEIRKAWPPAQALPGIIIVTGDSSSRLRRRINQAGIDEILLKPVPMQDIVSSALRVIQMDTSVQEKSVQSPAATIDYELGKLFSQELITRLPALDEYISQLKWKPAADKTANVVARLPALSSQVYRARDQAARIKSWISRTAFSSPTKIARAIIECPMFSSSICGKRATCWTLPR